MAGQKSSRATTDESKKRKRESHDDENKAKKIQRQLRRGKPSSETDKLRQDELEPHIKNGRESVLAPSHGESGWTISKPMGGRLLDIDPILTVDEKYLILTYNTCLQVFTTADSLLLRRIPIQSVDASAPDGPTPSHIVATRMSTCNDNLVWVACSDGQVYLVDWTCGAQVTPSFRAQSACAKAMVVVPSGAQGKKNDVIIIIEHKQNQIHLVPYLFDKGSVSKHKTLMTVPKPKSGLELFEASSDGQLLVGAIGNRLFVGNRDATLCEPKYNIYSFQVVEMITTLDMRIEQNTGVDVAVGGCQGAIFIYRDLLARLEKAGDGQSVETGINAQKLHWHRKAVHAAKWSRDGNYLISGGSESTLVIWQMDTCKRNFLPHLSGSVENIVVSASGASYVLQLDDNSAMIVSTAEMKPTTYVSGIQSAVASIGIPKDLLVKRVWTVADRVRRALPAAIKPSDPSKLHVCVGNGRQATMTGNLCAPLLQTFDLDNFTSVSKQALARTHPTYTNTTTKNYAVEEPFVSHIAFSGNGEWLASVDEWRPLAQGAPNTGGQVQHQTMSDMYEVYLKFWQVRHDDGSLALVSRINAPHSTSCPEKVLDLAADTASTCFATLGADAVVRLWRPRSHSQAGRSLSETSAEGAITSWTCSHATVIGTDVVGSTEIDAMGPATECKPQGNIAYSEDGSALFAAFGVGETGAVYVIDTASGQVVRTLQGLWQGRLHGIRCLSCYVIVLSDNVCVYDVVGDELRYGVAMPKMEDAGDLAQISVDYCSRHFAVTLPMAGMSCVGIFDPDEAEPLLVRTIPHSVISLVSAPDRSGFIALDDAAQLWVVRKESDGVSLMAARPLQDLQLDGGAEESGKEGESEVAAVVLPTEEVVMANGHDAQGLHEEDDEGEADGDVDMLDNDDGDDGSCPRVLPQQHLAEIFDAAPAFAGPSMEELFYRVTDLLVTKPQWA